MYAKYCTMQCTIPPHFNKLALFNQKSRYYVCSEKKSDIPWQVVKQIYGYKILQFTPASIHLECVRKGHLFQYLKF